MEEVMEAEIYTWIKNIVIYMIINTIIMNLLGNKSYKKYISIISGMILVLIVISPLAKLLNLDDNLNYFLQYNDFAIDTSDFKNDINQMEEKQKDKIFQKYSNKIKSQVKQQLLTDNVYMKSCKITFDKDEKSNTYGEIVGMNITASLQKTQETGNSKLVIENIEIPHINIGKKDKETASQMMSPLEISIKKELADFYNLKQGNINISIQGG
jgi:stage III sporulation protein AF